MRSQMKAEHGLQKVSHPDFIKSWSCVYLMHELPRSKFRRVLFVSIANLGGVVQIKNVKRARYTEYTMKVKWNT